MSNIRRLTGLGQSIWADYISRSFLKNGQLKALIQQGLGGVTSNPTIFDKAISSSNDYDEAIKRLIEQDKNVEEIYEALTVQDIKEALDLFKPVYEATEGLDGFVSLEVAPQLAYLVKETIAEAKKLFALLNRPNAMIKIPGTPQGIVAMEQAIAMGINVNVTLLFSVTNYREVALAYVRGLETRARQGGDLSKVASVASFFVSRIDSAADQALISKKNKTLQGKIAIANAKLAYAAFEEIFSGPLWQELASQGARKQRLLWASTSTKNPDYSDTLYVDELIGPDTVNTLPLNTLEAFQDHGTPAVTISRGLEQAKGQLAELAELGIDLEAIHQTLQKDGVLAFEKSFENLMKSIKEKRDTLCTV